MSPDHYTPRHRLIVDEEACGNAVECLKCVHVCRDHGQNVIGFVNKETPDLEEFVPRKLEEIDHRVMGCFMINCDGCAKCVDVCPKGALSLERAEVPVPRAVINKEPAIIMCSVLKDGTRIVLED
jgi:NAD-dependent dihydropyrimidine dehydrogenase PreA subunit